MKGALKGRVTPSMGSVSQEKSQALPSLEEALFLRNKYHLRKNQQNEASLVVYKL